MKKHQFKYIFLLFTLILFGVASLVYSQDTHEQSNGEQIPTEQSDDGTILTEQTPKEPNPLNKQISDLKNDVVNIELSLGAMQDRLNNPFQAFLMIFGTIIILIIGVLFFLSKREIRQLQYRFENSQRQWTDRSKEDDLRWDGQLKYIRQQGKENTEKLEDMMSNHTSLRNEQEILQSSLSKTERRLDGFELTFANYGSESVPEKTDDDEPQVNDHSQLDMILQEAQEQIQLLALAYESGEPIDMINIEHPTPSQNVVLILNLIARLIEEWESKLKRSNTSDSNLIQSLGYANQAIKDKLKDIRGPAPPLPIDLELDTDIANNEAQEKCNAYVSRYEGMLTGLQLGLKFDETEYNQFIPQFIKDRLFNSVVRFIQYDNIPEQLNEFLQLVGFEIVPIEIGKTCADSRFHEIQSSRKTNAESGTIAEVILPGLQRIDGGEIVQKPVVVRGE